MGQPPVLADIRLYEPIDDEIARIGKPAYKVTPDLYAFVGDGLTVETFPRTGRVKAIRVSHDFKYVTPRGLAVGSAPEAVSQYYGVAGPHPQLQ